MFEFTSESVTGGHPDKVADRISDTILDAYLTADATSHVAVETLVAPGNVIVAGEVTSHGDVNVDDTVRAAIADLGYTIPGIGFDAATVTVTNLIGTQSPNIAGGVGTSTEARDGSTDPDDRQGAGDQGLMFGYACNETADLMPYPIHVAHRLTEQLNRARQTGEAPWLRPDGKSQVTVTYDHAGVPRTIDTVVLSAHHADTATRGDVEAFATALIRDTLTVHAPTLDWSNCRFLINPAGPFIVGGPAADSGLTGRKVIVDTYGGMARHGGGAFSGKDPSKVDRSAAYAARWVAKNVVAAGLAARCEVQVAYAIGVAHPVSVRVDTFGTETVPRDRIETAVRDVFDLRPAAIVRDLDLLRPVYAETSAYGHFGRNGFTWERTDRAGDLRAHVDGAGTVIVPPLPVPVTVLPGAVLTMTRPSVPARPGRGYWATRHDDTPTGRPVTVRPHTRSA